MRYSIDQDMSMYKYDQDMSMYKYLKVKIPDFSWKKKSLF
jgi:hypothetical protein